jgi:biopolymer transport protein ExbD
MSSFLLVAAGPLPAPVVAEVGNDGSVVIEGVRYAGASPLKAKLEQLKKRHVDVVLHIKQDAGRPFRFEVLGKVIKLFQEAGYPRVGFITEQRAR